MFLLRVEERKKTESFLLSSGTSTTAHSSRLKSPLVRGVSIFPAQQPTTSVSFCIHIKSSLCLWFFALYREIVKQSSNLPLAQHSLKMPVKQPKCHESNAKANGCTEMLQNVCTCLHHEKSCGFLQKRHFHWGTSVFFTIFAARFTSKEHLSAAPNRQLTDLNLLQGHVWVFPKIRVSPNYEF